MKSDPETSKSTEGQEQALHVSAPEPGAGSRTAGADPEVVPSKTRLEPEVPPRGITTVARKAHAGAGGAVFGVLTYEPQRWHSTLSRCFLLVGRRDPERLDRSGRSLFGQPRPFSSKTREHSLSSSFGNFNPGHSFKLLLGFQIATL